MKEIFLVAVVGLVWALAGCGPSGASKEAAVATEAENPEAAAMSKHLEQMTPEQRAQYVRQNQGEIQRIYSGVESGPAEGR